LILESLPRFTFGASSGGIFSSIFVTNQRYKIQGQIIFISIVHPEILGTYVKTKNYPPTAWIYVRKKITIRFCIIFYLIFFSSLSLRCYVILNLLLKNV
jgi:hypothetical protein